jgi:hypothetical protein
MLSKYFGATGDQDGWRYDGWKKEGLIEVAGLPSNYKKFNESRYQFETGVTIELTRFVSVTVEPYALLHGERCLVQTIDCSDIQRINERFEEILRSKQMPVQFPDLSEGALNEIEYVIDISVPNGKHFGNLEQYEELFKRGRVLKHFSLRTTKRIGALFVNRAFSIQCCSLHRVLNKLTLLHPVQLEEVINILRYSVVYRRRKITLTTRRSGYRSEFEVFFNPPVFLKVLKKTLMSIASGNDFYSVRKAAAIIKYQNGFDKRIKDGCRDFLKAIDVAGGLESAIQRWREGKAIEIRYGPRRLKMLLQLHQVQRRINQLRIFGISPIALPVSWKIGMMVNPLGDFLRNSDALPPKQLRCSVLSIENRNEYYEKDGMPF